MSTISTNIIVKSSDWAHSDAKTLFEDEEVYWTDSQDISVLMKELGIYESTSKARQAGRKGPIPSGFTQFKASKKITIWIWNPHE